MGLLDEDYSEYLLFSTLCTPHRSKPSSVSVPVCSGKTERSYAGMLSNESEIVSTEGAVSYQKS